MILTVLHFILINTMGWLVGCCTCRRSEESGGSVPHRLRSHHERAEQRVEEEKVSVRCLGGDGELCSVCCIRCRIHTLYAVELPAINTHNISVCCHLGVVGPDHV